MEKKHATLAMTLTLAALAVAGFVDSVRDDRGGPAVLFALLFVGVGVLGRSQAAAGGVVLRRDLRSWLDRVTPTTGETPETASNRAVSRLRAGFHGSLEPDE